MKYPKEPAKHLRREIPKYLKGIEHLAPPTFYDTDNALMLLNGEIRRDGPIAKTVFPTTTTEPTEEECYASVARTLKEIADEHEGDGVDEFLRALASCFDPNSKHRRIAKIRNRGKDYETDEDRDESIAWKVWKLAKTRGKKRAIAEVAVLIGCGEKAVRDARKRDLTGRGLLSGWSRSRSTRWRAAGRAATATLTVTQLLRRGRD
jgi:hypothetical protein